MPSPRPSAPRLSFVVALTDTHSCPTWKASAMLREISAARGPTTGAYATTVTSTFPRRPPLRSPPAGRKHRVGWRPPGRRSGDRIPHPARARALARIRQRDGGNRRAVLEPIRDDAPDQLRTRQRSRAVVNRHGGGRGRQRAEAARHGFVPFATAFHPAHDLGG